MRSYVNDSSRNQIDIILLALDNSCKYADSEYIEAVNSIIEELSITRVSSMNKYEITFDEQYQLIKLYDLLRDTGMIDDHYLFEKINGLIIMKKVSLHLLLTT